jgi:mRNA interferase RelE/StbE
MKYEMILTDRARGSLKAMSPQVSRRVVGKLERLRSGLVGDVKRLTNFEPAYRLRVGDWRVLFDISGRDDRGPGCETSLAGL